MPTDFELKPDETNREFATGAVRGGDEDKREVRIDLISPFALIRLGRWYGKGAKKYSERNWEKGMPFSVFWESLMRHVVAWQSGKRDEDHLAAIVFNAMAIMHFEELGQYELNDMPNYMRIIDEVSFEEIEEEINHTLQPEEENKIDQTKKKLSKLFGLG